MLENFSQHGEKNNQLLASLKIESIRFVYFLQLISEIHGLQQNLAYFFLI